MSLKAEHDSLECGLLAPTADRLPRLYPVVLSYRCDSSMTDSRLSKTNSYKFTCSRSDCLVLENRRFSRAVANSVTGQALRTSAALFLVTHLEGRILPDVRLRAVIRLRPVPVSTNLARLSSQRVRSAGITFCRSTMVIGSWTCGGAISPCTVRVSLPSRLYAYAYRKCHLRLARDGASVDRTGDAIKITLDIERPIASERLVRRGSRISNRVSPCHPALVEPLAVFTRAGLVRS